MGQGWVEGCSGAGYRGAGRFGDGTGSSGCRGTLAARVFAVRGSGRVGVPGCCWGTGVLALSGASGAAQPSPAPPGTAGAALMKVWLRGSGGRANAEPNRAPLGPSRTPERTCPGVGGGREARRDPRAGAGTHHPSTELLAHNRAPHGLPGPGTARLWGSWTNLGPDPGPGSCPGPGSQHSLHPSAPSVSPVQARCPRCPTGASEPGPVRHRPSPGDPGASPSSRAAHGVWPGPGTPGTPPGAAGAPPGAGAPAGRGSGAAPAPPPAHPCPRLRGGESAAGAGDPRPGRVRSHLYLPGAIRGGAGVTAGPARPPRRGSIAFCRRREENRYRHRTRHRGTEGPGSPTPQPILPEPPPPAGHARGRGSISPLIIDGGSRRDRAGLRGRGF